MATVLSIISLLLPLVIDYWQGRRSDPYAKKQTFRKAVIGGDVNAINIRIDRLREAYSRSHGGKPNGAD